MLHNPLSYFCVAHRGDCENHIENTLESIQTAIDNELKHIEIDVQLTQEGLPIVFHDNNLKRMFNINTQIAEVKFEDIKSLPLKSKDNKKYYIPMLSEVVSLLKKYPHITLYVEVKNINFSYFSYQHVYKTILKTIQPIIKHVVIIGFSYRFLKLVKKYSTLPVAYVLPSWRHYSEKMIANLQPEIIFSDINIIPSNEKFNTKKEVWVVYEVSNIEQAKQLLNKGIVGLESFTPSALEKELSHKKT